MRCTGLLAACVLQAALAGFAAGTPAEDDGIDVQAYVIDAVIEESSLSETVAIQAEARKKVGKLVLSLAPAMTVQSCRVGGADVPCQRDGEKLEIDLTKTEAGKGAFEVVIAASGRPHVQFSQDRGGFVRTNVCADHAYIRSQYAWYPRVPDDPARFTTTIEAREDWVVRTAGKLEEKTAKDGRCAWRFQLDQPERGIGLAAGDYAVVERAAPGLAALDALVFAGHEDGAGALLDTAAKALDFFTSLYGPIELDRFSLVEMPEAFGAGSGYGEAGYVLIGTGAFEAAGQAPWADALVAHEVSHSWWGREVAFANFASEMLATYATNRYTEERVDAAAARKERQGFVRNVVDTAPKGEVALSAIRSWGGDMDPAVYHAHAYDKGCMLLRALEKEMGRKALDAALKKFLDQHRGATVDYETLKKDLGGSRWKWVFDQWGGPGIPRLAMEHECSKKGSRYAVSGKLIQDGTAEPFRMNVTLAAVAGDQSCNHEVQVKKAETPFKFDCPFEPQEILIDPEGELVVAQTGMADEKAVVDRLAKVGNSPNEGDKEVLTRTIAELQTLVRKKSEYEGLYYTFLGRCLFRLDRRDEAREAFDNALRLGAGGPFHRAWIQLRLGCMHDLDGDRRKAEACYKQVVSAPGSSDVTKQLAERFLQTPYRGYALDH